MNDHPPKPRKYRTILSNRYKHDIRRLRKSRVDLTRLEAVIDLLADGFSLPERCRDHELRGSMKGIRECHIGPDWLLTYEKNNDALILLLLRTGTHRDVLGIE